MRPLLIPIAGVCLFACAAQATAQETTAIRGNVRTVAPDSITVQVNDTAMTFKVDARTDVTARGASTATRAARAEGKPGPALPDLVKPGQAVEVRYHADMHAASIRVLPGLSAGQPGDDQSTTATGTVTAVAASSLTIRAASGDLTFAIDDKTVVIARGAGTATREKKVAGEKPVIADFVGSGDTVSVRYREVSGRKVASEVRVTRKRAS